MGGYGSGGHRWGHFRATVEACYRVDAKMLRGLFTVAPGAPVRAAWVYSSNRGDRVSTIAEYTGGAPTFTLRTKRDGAECKTQQIAVTFSPCAYGGRRAWLVCPRCARRVFRLYSYIHLIDRTGAPLVVFQCRTCAHVWYDSQRENDDYHNLKAQAGKIKKRLGGDSAYMASFPEKPRWMRYRTYWRLMQKWQALEMRANETMMLDAARKFPYIFKSAGVPLPEPDKT